MADGDDSGASIRVALVAAAEALVQLLGPRQGVVTHTLEDSGDLTEDSAAHRATFSRRLDDTIRRLRYEYGNTADPEWARRAGIDSEALLGPPDPSTTDDELCVFAVWYTRELWLFLTGRHYQVGPVHRSVLLLGVGRGGKERAVARLA